MIKNACLAMCFMVLAGLPLCAQTNTFCQANGEPTNNAGKLVCLLPNLGFPLLTSGQDPIGGLDAAVASQAGLFPLASPASGIVYTNDPSLQIPVASGTESFGPVMFERGETLHRRKVFIAFTYQNFQFSNMDGINLKSIPAYFLLPNQTPNTYVETNSRVDLKINQFAVYATFGLTNRIDVSVAIPFLDVKLGATSTCESAFEVGVGSGTCKFALNNGTTATTVTKSQGATGIGDLVVRVKGSLRQGERFRLAAAVDVRMPTGDSLNFLGTGAWGVRPFLAASWRGRVAPHVDLGYQWNGNSNIASSQGPGVSGKLPDNLFWVGGADARVVKRLTLSADYLGQHIFSALREAVQVEPNSGFSGIYTASSSFNTNYASVGAKVNPVGNLLITANVFFKLDNNGLHNKPAPLVGISYTF
jgi:hypothetical protein